MERIWYSISASRSRSTLSSLHGYFSSLGHGELKEIISKSDMAHQQESAGLRIAYQGVAGSYSEAAAMVSCLDCIPVPCRSIAGAIEAVENGQADRAVMSVESTMEGNKVRNYELLLERNLHITQEINLFVHYCLLAIPGVRKGEVKRVISHPLALAHCGQGLARLGLTASREAVDDTAGAVELLLSQHMLDTAAIASPRAADLYHLQVLAQDVQDESWNVTRFLILSKQPEKIKKVGTLKTSMVVAHEGGLQPLLRVLSVFSSRKINLAKLEVNNFEAERVRILDVHKGSADEFQHAFYVDFEGTTEDPKVKDAIAEISAFSKFSRILGCYPVDSKIYDLS
ncbi:Arogenate dehydratase/prephenate dehydratase 6 [Nymphaea thermarum]|nr:Arogenate dehydratase/prephenate dehydratase 6 [Nymphaea thermarum]